MLQVPKDILLTYPSIQVKHSGTSAVLIPVGSDYSGEVLQSNHCIEIVLTGQNHIYWGDKEYQLKTYDIEFRKRGMYQIHPSKDYSALLFFMENESIQDFLNEHIVTYSKEQFESDLPPFHFTSTEFIKAQIEDIAKSIAVPETYSSCIVKLSLHQILLHILAKEKTKTFVTFLKFIITDRKVDLAYFIERNYMHRMELGDLAKHSGRSLSTFKKEFKSLFGIPPIKWIMNRRIEYAHYLLLNTPQSVSEICFQAGFENLAHFSKTYKLKYGHTPSERRK